MPLAESPSGQKSPAAYLEQLFAEAAPGGLVRSARGPGGGYRLARAADEISIAEIMLAVDEPSRMTRCADDGTRVAWRRSAA